MDQVLKQAVAKAEDRINLLTYGVLHCIIKEKDVKSEITLLKRQVRLLKKRDKEGKL